MPTPKIAILGTSNSILKGGWVDGLKKIHPDIINYSLASSPSLYAHYIINKFHILDNNDILILDFALNDTYFIQHNTISPHFLIKSFEALLQVLTRQERCTPVFLVFVNRMLYREKILSLFELHINLIASYGIPYFFIGELLEKTHLPVSHPQFFLDDWHISREVSNIIGETFGYLLQQAVDHWRRQEKRNTSNAVPVFSVPQSVTEEAVEKRIRKTSLAEYEAYEFKDYSRLAIDDEDKMVCAAFVAQEAFTSCCLSAINDKQEHYCFKAKSHVSSLTFMFLSMYSPMRPRNTFIYGYNLQPFCEAQCGLRTSDPVSPFYLIDALLVSDYSPDDSIRIVDHGDMQKQALNMVAYLSTEQLKNVTRNILMHLDDGSGA